MCCWGGNITALPGGGKEGVPDLVGDRGAENFVTDEGVMAGLEDGAGYEGGWGVGEDIGFGDGGAGGLANERNAFWVLKGC